MIPRPLFVARAFILALALLVAPPLASAEKTMSISPDTPQPNRFIVRGTSLIDLSKPERPVFFRGMGYSPFLPGETPVRGLPPGNDGRYDNHLNLMKEMNANYIHVFPRLMPPNFFTALDKTDLVYSQDVWVWAYEEDFLAPAFQAKTLDDIKEVIDHTYKFGRPDRLVLFSIGDELQAKCVTATDARHPEVRNYQGKHLSVTNRTPTEVAMAKLVDGAMEYELSRYGRRHLYCHTSWTHIGPIADRPDIEVSQESVLVPDMGDLICLNVYTYANGVRTSPPGSVTGTTYQGYLEQLAKESKQPILVTQVGLATSPIAPKPTTNPGFGGHKIEDVPAIFSSVWRDIRTARGKEKYSGLVFFELQDEWWKSAKGPEKALRQDADDPEQWFGVYSVDNTHTLTPKGAIPATIKKLFAEP
ncbi:hypothetical protein [uncultured Desulfobulbus sp.]|uniref:hypothetical protein n=1 Tax=uncultured Desulfobulbus sp. TaxID=239745 RepID=UPI0029C8BACA|nr:hypothetical protein [uncultured Desulfobulbus sp.]